MDYENEVVPSLGEPEPAVVEATDVGEVVGESPTPEPIETPGEDAAAAPKKDRVQERIDELTRKRYEAEREREYWKGQAEALTPGRGKEVETPKVPDQATLTEPQEDQFDNYSDYTRALVQHEARKLVAQQEATRNQEQAHQQAQEKQRTYQDWVSKGKDKYADFSEIAEAQTIPYTQAMADAIVGSDTGLDIAYYFGKNPDEAKRIANLGPLQAAKEIGRLEVKLTAGEPGKKVSAAPTPIRPVAGGPAIPTDINAIEDDEAWLKAERERLAKQGRLY